MLRIDFGGRRYEWLDVEEHWDLVEAGLFDEALRENISRYFGVPPESQVILGDGAAMRSAVDYADFFGAKARPRLCVLDARHLVDAGRPDRLRATAANVGRQAGGIETRVDPGLRQLSRGASRGAPPRRALNSGMADVAVCPSEATSTPCDGAAVLLLDELSARREEAEQECERMRRRLDSREPPAASAQGQALELRRFRGAGDSGAPAAPGHERAARPEGPTVPPGAIRSMPPPALW